MMFAVVIYYTLSIPLRSEEPRPSPSPSSDIDRFFMYVDFYREIEASPSPFPNFYDPQVMPPPPPSPTEKINSLCLQQISQVFSFWESLSVNCKQSMYLLDKRWHDHAMNLECRDAELECREFGTEKASETYNSDFAREMMLDIQDFVSIIDVCNADMNNLIRTKRFMQLNEMFSILDDIIKWSKSFFF